MCAGRSGSVSAATRHGAAPEWRTEDDTQRGSSIRGGWLDKWGDGGDAWSNAATGQEWSGDAWGSATVPSSSQGVGTAAAQQRHDGGWSGWDAGAWETTAAIYGWRPRKTPVRIRPGCTPEQDARLTEWRKNHRPCSCDRCGEKKVYEGRVQAWDGSYLDHSWRGWCDFRELRGAWENGEIDISWWCRKCLSKQWRVRPGFIGREDSERRLCKRRESAKRRVPP